MINYKQYLIYLQMKTLNEQFCALYPPSLPILEITHRPTDTVVFREEVAADDVEAITNNYDPDTHFVIYMSEPLSIFSTPILDFISGRFNIPITDIHDRVAYLMDNYSFRPGITPLTPTQLYYLQTGSYSVPTTPEWTA